MHRILFLAAAAAFVASPGQTKGLQWMDATGVGLPAGGKVAVVKGDPSNAAPFAVRIKMPAGYTVPPHKHPGDEVVRVVSAGTLSYGMGDKLNKTNVGSLTKGYHVTMMAGMNHYVFTTDPVEVQVDGMGPFAITYVDPKDDPRTK